MPPCADVQLRTHQPLAVRLHDPPRPVRCPPAFRYPFLPLLHLLVCPIHLVASLRPISCSSCLSSLCLSSLCLTNLCHTSLCLSSFCLTSLCFYSLSSPLPITPLFPTHYLVCPQKCTASVCSFDDPLHLLPKPQHQPHIPHQQLAHLARQIPVDHLTVPHAPVILVIRRHEAHHAVVRKYIP